MSAVESTSHTVTADNDGIGFGSHGVPKSTQPQEDTGNNASNSTPTLCKVYPVKDRLYTYSSRHLHKRPLKRHNFDRHEFELQVEHPMNEISAERACPSVHCIEPGPLEAQEPLAEPPPAEIDLLRTPKRELDEDVDVELLDDPPLPIREHRSSCASPSTTTTPSLPTLAASSSAANASVPVAYFGDAVFDRPSDPSSFTYE